jgi:hypothetical protein
MLPAKIYPLTIAPNASFTLQVVGDMFKVLSASGAFEVTGDTFGSMGAIQPGQGLDNTPFQRLTFRDTSGGSNTLSVLVAGTDFIDDRITGEVSVIDGGKARTLAGLSFMASVNINNAATKFSTFYLYNFHNSRTTFVTSLLIGSAVAQPIYVCYGSGAPTSPPVGAGASMVPKDIGNASGSSSLFYEVQNAAAPTTSIIAAIIVPANLMQLVKFEEPIAIRGTRWMAVTTSTLDSSLQVVAQAWEETRL